MQRFYENWRGPYDDERFGKRAERMTKAEALREAKKWLRQYEDASKRRPYEHPFFWSGFILIGDPR